MSTRKFVDSFFNFLADPKGLTQKEVCSELKEIGINPRKLKKKAKKIIKENRERCCECRKPLCGLSRQKEKTKKSWKFYCNDCFKNKLKESQNER